MDDDDSEEVRLTLRLPARVRDELQKKSKEGGRSLNAEIVSRLERSISFEEEYGSIEENMVELWKKIDEMDAMLIEHNRQISPMNYDWK